MRFFFHRKPLNPLAQALQLVNAAAEIVIEHKRTKSFMPTEDDMETLLLINEAFHRGYFAVVYVERGLRRRLAGKPEGSAGWANPETFDYHYPE